MKKLFISQPMRDPIAEAENDQSAYQNATSNDNVPHFGDIEALHEFSDKCTHTCYWIRNYSLLNFLVAFSLLNKSSLVKPVIS